MHPYEQCKVFKKYVILENGRQSNLIKIHLNPKKLKFLLFVIKIAKKSTQKEVVCGHTFLQAIVIPSKNLQVQHFVKFCKVSSILINQNRRYYIKTMFLRASQTAYIILIYLAPPLVDILYKLRKAQNLKTILSNNTNLSSMLILA